VNTALERLQEVEDRCGMIIKAATRYRREGEGMIANLYSDFRNWQSVMESLGLVRCSDDPNENSSVEYVNVISSPNWIDVLDRALFAAVRTLTIDCVREPASPNRSSEFWTAHIKADCQWAEATLPCVLEELRALHAEAVTLTALRQQQHLDDQAPSLSDKSEPTSSDDSQAVSKSLVSSLDSNIERLTKLATKLSNSKHTLTPFTNSETSDSAVKSEHSTSSQGRPEGLLNTYFQMIRSIMEPFRPPTATSSTEVSARSEDSQSRSADQVHMLCEPLANRLLLHLELLQGYLKYDSRDNKSQVEGCGGSRRQVCRDILRYFLRLAPYPFNEVNDLDPLPVTALQPALVRTLSEGIVGRLFEYIVSVDVAIRPSLQTLRPQLSESGAAMQILLKDIKDVIDSSAEEVFHELRVTSEHVGATRLFAMRFRDDYLGKVPIQSHFATVQSLPELPRMNTSTTTLLPGAGSSLPDLQSPPAPSSQPDDNQAHLMATTIKRDLRAAGDKFNVLYSTAQAFRTLTRSLEASTATFSGIVRVMLSLLETIRDNAFRLNGTVPTTFDFRVFNQLVDGVSEANLVIKEAQQLLRVLTPYTRELKRRAVVQTAMEEAQRAVMLALSEWQRHEMTLQKKATQAIWSSRPETLSLHQLPEPLQREIQEACTTNTTSHAEVNGEQDGCSTGIESYTRALRMLLDMANTMKTGRKPKSLTTTTTTHEMPDKGQSLHSMPGVISGGNFGGTGIADAYVRTSPVPAVRLQRRELAEATPSDQVRTYVYYAPANPSVLPQQQQQQHQQRQTFIGQYQHQHQHHHQVIVGPGPGNPQATSVTPQNVHHMSRSSSRGSLGVGTVQSNPSDSPQSSVPKPTLASVVPGTTIWGSQSLVNSSLGPSQIYSNPSYTSTMTMPTVSMSPQHHCVVKHELPAGGVFHSVAPSGQNVISSAAGGAPSPHPAASAQAPGQVSVTSGYVMAPQASDLTNVPGGLPPMSPKQVPVPATALAFLKTHQGPSGQGAQTPSSASPLVTYSPHLSGIAGPKVAPGGSQHYIVYATPTHPAQVSHYSYFTPVQSQTPPSLLPSAQVSNSSSAQGLPSPFFTPTRVSTPQNNSTPNEGADSTYVQQASSSNGQH